MANLTRRLCLAIALCALYPLAAAGTALADDLGAGQAAGTGQQAIANGLATQTAPTNMVVSVRINSPGANGPISQSNVAVATVGATNDSATSQGGPSGADGAQQAATGQGAAATGAGTQSQPSNIVISIRINSPGNDGPIAQTNVVAVGVGADNASSTDQTAGSAVPQQAPRTATPVKHILRHGAAPAEVADETTATHSRRPAPRRSAPTPSRAANAAPKSPERSFSGAAAAHTAVVQAAAARASTPTTKPNESIRSTSVSHMPHTAASVLRHVERGLPSVSANAATASGAGPLALSAIALLGALLVWLSSTWLGGTRRGTRRAWGIRP